MPSSLQARLDALGRSGPERVVPAVDFVLEESIRRAASDVHFEPTPAALEIRMRVDGVLNPAATLPRELAPNVIARLKVLADLLTYRVDIPQEGGMRPGGATRTEDMRVSTFPTVHGEKAVVRIFNNSAQLLDLDQLGLRPDVSKSLTGLLSERTGAVYLTGPSGSGKTTTIYACLRRLAHDGGRNIVTIEDPVERWVEGVSQSQARPGTEFDFARGLRSLLRQDPDVIMVGEIRDRETAAVASEAALTGHLVFSTLHAGSACGVVGRLLEMGVEPYILTSGIKGILNQRLLRRLCEGCRRRVGASWEPAGCERCGGAGYRGRLLIAELLTPDADFRRAILAKADTEALEAVAGKSEWQSLRAAADAAVAAGQTTAEEVARVLGPQPFAR
ncbi:MAG TPA: GspE/PulE family protein [Gemmataceae bacterium]|jgi:type II secretory ATPase GspE/PulE/Tfp pilus assembly ATPase PilB-like protein|nr:GspE/PulE family protein [Gemmataceae bacterium]